MENIANFDAVEDTESILIRLAVAGCPKSMDLLIASYRKTVYYFIRSLGIRKHHDAEELVQETLIQIHKSLVRFEGRSKFSSWVFSIARNLVRNHLGRSYQYRYVFTDIDDATIVDENRNNDPLKYLLQSDTQALLTENIRNLSDSLRVPILLVVVHGLSYSDTAKHLNISVASVKSRLFRARGELKDAMAEELS